MSLPYYESQPCGFEFLLPDAENCPRPGFSAEANVLIAQILLGGRVRLLPIKEWFHSVTGNANLSVWDDLRAGRVDSTNPYFTISHGHHLRSLRPLGVVSVLHLGLLYRQRTQLVGFSLESLFLRPSGVWLLLTLAVALKLFLKTATSALPPLARAYRRHRIAFHFVLGLLLSLLSNYLCILFSVQPRHLPYLSGRDSFYEKLLSGEIRLIGDEFTLGHPGLLGPLRESRPKDYAALMARNPPLVHNDLDGIPAAMAQDLGLVAAMLDFPRIKSSFSRQLCDVESLELDAPMLLSSAFVLDSLPGKVFEQAGRLATLQVELERLEKAHSFPRAACKRVEEANWILQLPQIQGVLVSLALALAASVPCFALELLSSSVPSACRPIYSLYRLLFAC